MVLGHACMFVCMLAIMYLHVYGLLYCKYVLVHECICDPLCIYMYVSMCVTSTCMHSDKKHNIYTFSDRVVNYAVSACRSLLPEQLFCNTQPSLDARNLTTSISSLDLFIDGTMFASHVNQWNQLLLRRGWWVHGLPVAPCPVVLGDIQLPGVWDEGVRRARHEPQAATGWHCEPTWLARNHQGYWSVSSIYIYIYIWLSNKK